MQITKEWKLELGCENLWTLALEVGKVLLFFKKNERLSHNTWCCVALWHQAASEGTSWMSWLRRSPWKSGVGSAVFPQTLTLPLWMGSQGANTVVTSNFHGLLSNLLVLTCFALSSWTISILLRYCLHYSHTYLGLFFVFGPMTTFGLRQEPPLFTHDLVHPSPQRTQ